MDSSPSSVRKAIREIDVSYTEIAHLIGKSISTVSYSVNDETGNVINRQARRKDICIVIAHIHESGLDAVRKYVDAHGSEALLACPVGAIGAGGDGAARGELEI